MARNAPARSSSERIQLISKSSADDDDDPETRITFQKMRKFDFGAYSSYHERGWAEGERLRTEVSETGSDQNGKCHTKTVTCAKVGVSQPAFPRIAL
jgi:hypothetical protein